MADKRKILTAEELDAMSPDERAAAFRDRIVTDPDEVRDEFRQRIFETAKRLDAERADRA